MSHSFADRYTLERELGRGGMATVWLARDLRHERRVALKLLHSELAGAIGVERFVREVRLTARLSHPNVAPLLDSGIVQSGDGTSQPWFVMPFLEGESLRARLERERQLPIEEALRITGEVGAALQAAHEVGIVHRDIKPENVLLTADRVWVVDFGIAKALADSEGERLTSTGLAIGTPAYMSPEQCSAEPVDARSDQYSLASMLYEMLAGEPPFTGPTAQAITARRLTERARPLVAVRSTVSPAVERALLKALERVPADRFPDVAGFVAGLRARELHTADYAEKRRGTRKETGRNSLIAVGLGALVLLGGWLLLRPRSARAVDPEVVTLYRRGMAGYDRRTPAGIVDAIASLQAALKRDSGYAPAWSGLAQVYLRAEERGFPVAGMSRDSMIQAAVAAVDRALGLDSTDAHAWTARAILSLRVDPTDQGPARRALQRAFALDSTNPVAWHFQARLYAESGGDLPGAIRAWHRAVALDPRYTQGLAFLGLGFYWHHQFDSAAVWADSALALDPSYLLGRTTAGAIAIERGDYPKALSAFDVAKRLTNSVAMVEAMVGTALTKARMGEPRQARELLALVDSMSRSFVPMPLHTAVYVAQAWAELGDPGPVVRWLEKYDRPRDLHFQLHLRCDPPFDRIRAKSGYAALLLPGGSC